MEADTIHLLKINIERKLGRPIRKPKDLKYLKDQIFEINNEEIGFNTLRRFFGFLPTTALHNKTLEVLCKFVGFENKIAFIKQIEAKNSWDSWKRINQIELAGSISAADIIWLQKIISYDDYYIYLSSILKEFVASKNIDAVYTIYKTTPLFEIPRFQIVKVANIVGSRLREYSSSEFELLRPLLSLENFRKNFMYLHVDYQELNGYYGWLLQASTSKLIHTDEKLFTKLIQNYSLFLNHKKDIQDLSKEKIPRPCHPILYGRFLGYQLLFFREKGFEIYLQKIFQEVKNQNLKIEFFHEIFPILIILKRIDIIHQIVDLYYEDLYEKHNWDHVNAMNVYLVGQSFVFLREKNFKSSKKCLEFINYNTIAAGSNELFLKLFHLISKYNYTLYTSGDKDILDSIKSDYCRIVEQTKFYFFTVAFMEDYFKEIAQPNLEQ